MNGGLDWVVQRASVATGGSFAGSVKGWVGGQACQWMCVRLAGGGKFGYFVDCKDQMVGKTDGSVCGGHWRVSEQQIPTWLSARHLAQKQRGAPGSEV